jgi:hypothetical protein
MNNLSDKFDLDDLTELNDRLNKATFQINLLEQVADKLDESDICKLLISFDGIGKTAEMLNDVCTQLIIDDYITIADPLSYINSKSDLSFVFLDELIEKYSLYFQA